MNTKSSIRTFAWLLIFSVATLALGAAGKSEDPTMKIRAAVTAKLSAYFRSKAFTAGSSDVRVMGVQIVVDATEPTPGWHNRYSSRGTATLQLGGKGGSSKQVRSFDAASEVDAEGVVTVTDFSTR